MNANQANGNTVESNPMRADVLRRGPNATQPTTQRIGDAVCSRKSATAAPPESSCRSDRATWNTRKVTAMHRTPSSRSTQNQVGFRATRTASIAQVTMTMMLDWMVKKQNTLATRPARESK